MAEDFFPSFGTTAPAPAPAQAPPPTAAPPAAATTDFFPSFTTTQAPPPQEPHRATKDELFPPPTAELDYTPNYEPYKRIFQAGVEGAEGVPHIPRVPSDYVTAPFYNPVIAGAETLLRAGGGALRGLQQTAVEATPDIHLGSLPWAIPLGGNRSISGELTPGSLGREIAAGPEAFPDLAGFLRVPGRPPIPGTELRVPFTEQRVPFMHEATPSEPLPPRPSTIQELTAPPRPAGMTDLERMHQLIQHDTAPPPPEPGATPQAKPTFFGRDWMLNAGETGTGFDMTKGGNAMSSAADQALAAGHKVELVADGGKKIVPIVRVKDGMMYDDKGQQWGGVPVAFDGTGREGLRITPSAAPPPVEPVTPTAGTPAATPAAGPLPTRVRTAADAKAWSNDLYKTANDTGGTLTPQFTDAFIDNITKRVQPKTEAGAATVGPSEVDAMVQRWQALKGKPLTLNAVQEMDEGLTKLIGREYKPRLTEEGKELLEIQSDLRHSIDSAGVGDTTGGTAGFQALGDARGAWSIYRKMDDIERMWQRAEGVEGDTTTAFRRQVKSLLDSPTRSRGYSNIEKAWLKDAANRGVIGGTLHLFGNKLLMLGGALAEGRSGGIFPALAAAGGIHVAQRGMNWAGGRLQQRRVTGALGKFGGEVPQPPPPVPPP
jgi:hypothetical protein